MLYYEPIRDLNLVLKDKHGFFYDYAFEAKAECEKFIKNNLRYTYAEFLVNGKPLPCPGQSDKCSLDKPNKK